MRSPNRLETKERGEGEVKESCFLLNAFSLDYLYRVASTSRFMILCKGLPVSSHGPVISHLLFADDSLIFCKADLMQAQQLKAILEQYALLSGQQVNFDKSSILFSKNTSLTVKASILDILQGVKEQQ